MMKVINKIAAMAVMAASLVACGTGQAKADNADSTKTDNTTYMKPTDDKYVELTTDMGNIVVRLYGDTPRHQANFLKLVKDGYYNGVLFHRVIDNFMIQTGDPDSKTAASGQMLGSGGPGYEIDAEILYPKHFHKRGALAAARSGDQVNPQRRSSGSQFYIVTGEVLTPAQAAQMQEQFAFRDKQDEFNRLAQAEMPRIRQMQMAGDTAGLNKLQRELIAKVEAKYADAKAPELPKEIVEAYTTVGGTPHLDGTYTVFGEVVSGMDVVGKIEKVQTDANDRPTQDVHIISAKVIDNPAAAK